MWLHWLGKSWGMQSQAFESWTTCIICIHEGWMEIFRHALVREGSCPGGCAPSQTKGAPSWTCQKNQANEERALLQYFQRKMWVDCLCPIFSINCGLGKFKSSKLFDLLRSSPTGLTKIRYSDDGSSKQIQASYSELVKRTLNLRCLFLAKKLKSKVHAWKASAVKNLTPANFEASFWALYKKKGDQSFVMVWLNQIENVFLHIHPQISKSLPTKYGINIVKLWMLRQSLTV